MRYTMSKCAFVAWQQMTASNMTYKIPQVYPHCDSKSMHTHQAIPVPPHKVKATSPFVTNTRFCRIPQPVTPSRRIGRGGGGGTFHIRVGLVLTQHMRGWGGTFHRLCRGMLTRPIGCVLCYVLFCCDVLCCVVLCCIIPCFGLVFFVEGAVPASAPRAPPPPRIPPASRYTGFEAFCQNV